MAPGGCLRGYTLLTEEWRMRLICLYNQAGAHLGYFTRYLSNLDRKNVTTMRSFHVLLVEFI